MDTIDPPGPDVVKREIALEMARVHVDSYGGVALNLKVAIEDEMIAVMVDIEFSPAERTLLDAGRADAVRGAREAYQEAIGAVFVAIVERATGRRVISFVTRAAVSEEIPWGIEVFRLQPLAAVV